MSAPHHRRWLPPTSSFKTRFVVLSTLVKPFFNVPLKISSSTDSRYSLAEYGKYTEYAKWGGGSLMLPLFWSLFLMQTIYFGQEPHHTIDSKLLVK